jgi:hypothetical protein
MNQEISNMDDILDVRDIIERIEWLESDEAKDADEYQAKEIEEFANELKTLMAFMDEMKGMGGDEQWRGDWYPVTLIRDSYFEDYAQELAEDIGVIPSDLQWPLTCIDWEWAARELQMDYSAFDFDGVDYWGR